MAKTIKFTYENTEYMLEYNRSSVMTLEKQGFNIMDVNSKPVTAVMRLFGGAFLMHHGRLSNEKLDAIYNCLSNKSELLSRLIDMYSETVEALAVNKGETAGNVEWV